MWNFRYEKSLFPLFLFLDNFFEYFSKRWCIIMWLFICKNSLVHFSSLEMASNLICIYNISSGWVTWHCNKLHHLVWYGWAYLEVEYLNICHSMVYTDDWAEVTHCLEKLVINLQMHTQSVQEGKWKTNILCLTRIFPTFIVWCQLKHLRGCWRNLWHVYTNVRIFVTRSYECQNIPWLGSIHF